MERLLPTHYFHVVFTVPGELHGIALQNRRFFFDTLFASAAQTLLDFGEDPRWLGAQIGLTAVLHTWTRELRFHPHVHCVVTGGGLSREEQHWRSARRHFLFPVRALSKVFRGKMIEAIAAARHRGELHLLGESAALVQPDCFAEWRNKLFDKQWVVYSKTPFAGPEQVFSYLGRYTHRVGISNQRMLRADQQEVRFATKNGGTATVSPQEFIRRFLLHVLPPGFVKIRHFGLLASGNATTRLEVARRRLEQRQLPLQLRNIIPVIAALRLASGRSSEPAVDPAIRFLRLTGVDVTLCRNCGIGRLRRSPLPSREHSQPIAPDTS